MSLGALAALAGGLAFLLVGAELLVRGASRLAAAASIPPLVIGLTVVAYGTSAPELAVSLQAATAGQADIALGNVVGSNIFNVLFILGLAALITPLEVTRRLVRLDVPLMIGASVLALLAGLNGRVGRLEGAAMVVLGLAYTVYQIRQGRREGRELQPGGEPEIPAARTGPAAAAVLVLVGLGLLVLGSRWLVEGATAVARALGLSELIIGLTLVAAGTSLPEVATSVVAAVRGERDIAVGNVVGSNVFNLLWVLSLAAALSPDGVAVAPAAQRLDLPVMLAVAVACLPIFFTGYTIARWEGGLFFFYYLAYTGFLVGTATGSPTLRLFNGAMVAFVLPLTAVTLAVLAARAWRAERQRR